MKIDILASGSSGNCIAVRSGETTILVDAGIAKTKIEKRLLEVGIRADEIDAIFITHAHKDHTKGLPLANKYHIPVYASEGEWKSIKDEMNISIVLAKSEGSYPCCSVGDLAIYPFGVYHDAYEPLGYAIEDDEERCSVCLDTGKVDDEMLEMMEGTIYIIEANHDPEMVVESNYPTSVQARILSDIGHLSNEQTADALGRLVQGKGERIYLTHLSSHNNLPALAELIVKRALKSKGFEAGKHYEIEVV